MRTIHFTQSNGTEHTVKTPYSDVEAVAKLQSMMLNTPNSFAAKMVDSYFRYRNPSASTIGWIHKLAVEGFSKPTTISVTIGKRANEKIIELFGNAVKNGLKAPKLRMRNANVGIQLYFKANSFNKTIYINDLDKSEMGNFGYQKVYYGKIEAGEFVPSRKCPADVVEMIEAFADDPEGSVIAYGKMTNECCFCGRALTDDKSIKMGYGPVCKRKWM